MAMPIRLWNPMRTCESDDAGISITKMTLPSSTQQPTLYDTSGSTSNPLTFVPKLEVFCLKVLSQFPDQLHVVGSQKLNYSQSKSKYDIFRSLFPTWGTSSFSLSEVDPRLWATVIQVYSNVPEELVSYPIALGDEHLPLLQRIPSTEHFAMITVLDLRGCQELTDESVVNLKVLDQLCAFDASNTPLGTRGIRILSRSLIVEESGDKRGPWGLRILRLQKCRNVDNTVFEYAKDFPLLCALDVRETGCSTSHKLCAFRPTHHRELFAPHHLSDSLEFLYNFRRDLFSHNRPFFVSVQERLQRTAPQVKQRSSATKGRRNLQGSFVVLPSSSGTTSSRKHRATSRIQVGNIDAVEIAKKKELEAESKFKRDYAFCKQNGYDFDAYHHQGVKTFKDDIYDRDDLLHDLREMLENGEWPSEDERFALLSSELDLEEVLSLKLERRARRLWQHQDYDLATSSTTFYKKPLQRPHVSAARVEARHTDNGLMLFRDPPAWAHLENISHGKIRSPAGLRGIQGALTINAKGKKAISTMARTLKLKGTALVVEAKKSDRASANPFEQCRAESSGMVWSLWKKAENFEDISDDEPTTDTHKDPNVIGEGDRVLRPISNFKPPRLPPRLLPKMSKELRLKQSMLQINPTELRSKKHVNVDVSRKEQTQSLSFASSMTTKHLSKSSSKKMVNRSEDDEKSTRKKAKVGHAFDWEEWSKGSA